MQQRTTLCDSHAPSSSELPPSCSHSARQLSDHALIAQILGTTRAGIPPEELAISILTESQGLARIQGLGLSGLCELGLLEAQASRLIAALELGSRCLYQQLRSHRPKLPSFEAVVEWARPRLGALEHEEVWLLSLDSGNGLIQAQRIGQGGLHGCALLAQDVFRPGIRAGASSLILIHNHPSGDAAPSSEDVHLTRNLAETGHLLGIPLLDHVIIARQQASSMLARGVL